MNFPVNETFIQTKSEFYLQFANSTKNFSRTSHFDYTHVFWFLFVNFINCSEFHKKKQRNHAELLKRYSVSGLSQTNYYSIDKQMQDSTNNYIVLVICFWNPIQQIKPKKTSIVEVSATNLIFGCGGIRLPCTKCTFLPFNDRVKIDWFYVFIKLLLSIIYL